jgi:hypothetical protein
MAQAQRGCRAGTLNEGLTTRFHHGCLLILDGIENGLMVREHAQSAK